MIEHICDLVAGDPHPRSTSRIISEQFLKVSAKGVEEYILVCVFSDFFVESAPGVFAKGFQRSLVFQVGAPEGWRLMRSANK